MQNTKYLRYFSASPSVLILLFVVVFFAFILPLTYHRYSSNDDIGILLDIKSGFPVSFMSYILGDVFSLLYRKVSDIVPWYGIFTCISLGISLFVLLRMLYVSHGTKRIEYFMFSALLSILYIRFIQVQGYTETAIISGGVGILGLFLAFYQNKVNWYSTIGYGLLLCLCFLWRTQALFFVLVFFFPILLIRIRKYWAYCLLFLLPCILLYTANAIFAYLHSTPEQRYFDEFNRYRGKIHGTPLFELNIHNKALLQDVKWTVNDFIVYDDWLFFDESKYNVETLKQILSDENLIKPQVSTLNPQAILYSIKQIVYVYWKWIMIIAFLGILLILYCSREKILLCLFFFVYAMIGTVLLSTTVRFPMRLAHPMFFIVSSLYIIILLDSDPLNSIIKQPKWHTIRAFAMIICGVILILGSVMAIVKINRFNFNIGNIAYSTIENINKYVNYNSVLLVDGIYPDILSFTNPMKEYTDIFTVIPMGWPIFSPRFYAVLQDIGLKRGSEVFPYMIRSENAFIICGDSIKANIHTFIKQNYGIETEFRTIATFPKIKDIDVENFSMYKIQGKLK